MTWLRTEPQGEPLHLRHHVCTHLTLGFFRINSISFGRPDHGCTSTYIATNRVRFSSSLPFRTIPVVPCKETRT